jgi:uncharacterized protein (TIGR02391 family)
MARRILDTKLMEKIADRLGKNTLADVNKIVSRKASQLGISAEAALVLVAKQNGIGSAVYQRKLDAAKQAEIREALPSIFEQRTDTGGKAADRQNRRPTSSAGTPRNQLRAAVGYVLADNELRSRCEDLLLASKNFDRAINQATLVLEERIRMKAQPTQKLVGENLVNFAFKEDLMKTVLRVASNDADDQRGFTQILRGAVPAFRNKTHHHVINAFSREDALRVCGFIDVLLRTVDNAVKV